MRRDIEPMVPTMPRASDSIPTPQPDGGRVARPVAVEAPLVPDLR
jgi:hypothetical protein